jgi:hypothetical protein
MRSQWITGLLIAGGLGAVTFLLSPTTPSFSPPSNNSTPETLIVPGRLCLGFPIKADYPFIGPDINSPFECGAYCENRKTDLHFILYSNGYGAQCGIENCVDYGEDNCIPCTVPDVVLQRYDLRAPANATVCPLSSSSSSLSSGL